MSSIPECANLAQRATIAPHIALDEAVLAVMRGVQSKVPLDAAAEGSAAEIEAAAGLFEERGWLAMPATYHRTPPVLRDADILDVRGSRSWPLRHETMTFASGFRPRAMEPGAPRWLANGDNDVVHVRLLRHADIGAPWVICLHGFGMGSSRVDLAVLGATYLHTRLGFNVALPVSPLHGPRRENSTGQLLTLDLTSMLHGLTQALWDIRRLTSWIRTTTGAPVAVYGLSLGGFLATLLAGLEEYDGVVAALPFADVLELMKHHGPPSEYANVLRSADAQRVFRVVSPLAIPAIVPDHRRSLFVARGDRLIPSVQSAALSRTWAAGNVQHTHSGHVGFTWSREARVSVGKRLRAALHTPVRWDESHRNAL